MKAKKDGGVRAYFWYSFSWYLHVSSSELEPYNVGGNTAARQSGIVGFRSRVFGEFTIRVVDTTVEVIFWYPLSFYHSFFVGGPL